MSGSTRRTPGPLTPVNRPSVNITPRSYSFRIRIELITTSSNMTTTMGNEKLMARLLLILQRFHPQRQIHDFDDAGPLTRVQWTRGASIPQPSAEAHDALIPTIIDRFNRGADHGLDAGARRPAARARGQPDEGDDDEAAGNGEADDQLQCDAPPGRMVVE